MAIHDEIRKPLYVSRCILLLSSCDPTCFLQSHANWERHQILKEQKTNMATGKTGNASRGQQRTRRARTHTHTHKRTHMQTHRHTSQYYMYIYIYHVYRCIDACKLCMAPDSPTFRAEVAAAAQRHATNRFSNTAKPSSIASSERSPKIAVHPQQNFCLPFASFYSSLWS